MCKCLLANVKFNTLHAKYFFIAGNYIRLQQRTESGKRKEIKNVKLGLGKLIKDIDKNVQNVQSCSTCASSFT